VTFSTILIANRGEIARRVMRTSRQMGVRTVAVYVAADEQAPFVRDADVAVRLETGYLDGAAIVEAALATGAEAIHPGYGFLSENPQFARDVAAAGLTFIGPPVEAIVAMGDKLAAKALAIKAGVPTLPYSEGDEIGEVGFPLLVKASAGGGGKGMRIVERAEDLEEAVAAARREAASGFGNDTVFFERYVARSRHIEIQILGDQHGQLIHLGERECSIQRRHQKLIEETPSTAIDATTRAAMGEAALELARAIGYYSTGTVEFLVDDSNGDFYFLEVNTRLQVEHPVTEEVTGVDLVREQIRIAAGESLDLTQADVSFSGHSIEARLCAEDPSAGFLPATGTLAAFATAADPVVRWESGVERGSRVGVNFDPLLAKVISHAPTRAEAASRLALALEKLHLGGVTTNRDFLAAVLRHRSFLAGDTTTDFIDRCAPALALELTESDLGDLAAAGAMWLRGQNRSRAGALSSAPSNWRNARLPDEYVELRHGDHEMTVSYRANRDGSFLVGADVVRVYEHTEAGIDIEIGGRRAQRQITCAGSHLYVQGARGTAQFEIIPRFVAPGAEVHAGSLNAPMPGTILDVRVVVGDHVTKGATLVVMEAMKMEHHISAPHEGEVVDVLVAIGQQVENGAALLVLDEMDEAS